MLADSWQLCSLLLDYPEPELMDRLPVLRAALAGLPEQTASPLGTFLDHLEGVGLDAAQREYVETFDVTRKCSLHLTYFLYGDTRNRGVALVQFKQLYRRFGVVLSDEDAELPDYLPVVLEFGASVDVDAAWKVLNDHRVGIELLRRALAQRDSPWSSVVAGLRTTLPSLNDDDEVALAKLISQGPPEELVGITEGLDAPYALDPALDELRMHPNMASDGCGVPGHRHDNDQAHSPAHHLGTDIPVGAPR